MNLVREMEKKLETEVCVVYEATGVYHRVLKKVLEDNNIKQFIINPLLSAKTRKNDSLRSPKTDKLDPKSIAKTYYSHSLHNSHKQETIYPHNSVIIPSVHDISFLVYDCYEDYGCNMF